MNASSLSRPTSITQLIVSSLLSPGDTAIDATAGNGHDTLLLCQLVGDQGKVFAFDVQSEALENTRIRLNENGIDSSVYELLCMNHKEMDQLEMNPPRVIMFNLGYLPGGDPSLITQSNETLEAIEKAGKLLSPQGALTVMCYPGHTGGDIEAQRVQSLLSSWDGANWKIAKYELLNTLKPAPFLLCAYKMK